MHSVPAHLFQCLDRDLSREALHTLTPPEAARLADLLEHWRQLADLHAGRPAGEVSRETPIPAPARSRQSLSLEALLEAGGELAHALQDVVDRSLEAAGEGDAESLSAVQVDIDRIDAWETAYAAFGCGATGQESAA